MTPPPSPPSLLQAALLGSFPAPHSVDPGQRGPEGGAFAEAQKWGAGAFVGVSFLANLKVALKKAALLVEKWHRLDKDCRAKPLHSHERASLQAFLPHTLFPRPGCCCCAGGFPPQPLPPFS